LPAAKPNRRQVAVALALLPVAVASCAGLGGWLGVSFSQKNSTVQLATRVVAEEAGTVEGTTDYSTKFRESGTSVPTLTAEAQTIQRKFTQAGVWFGIWVGLVVGLKFVMASLPRRRADYEADQMNCVACARCYQFCPQEQHVARR
jgi:NAD-dependent dihydropyrimidine dehydrogenase PreA subunit